MQFIHWGNSWTVCSKSDVCIPMHVCVQSVILLSMFLQWMCSQPDLFSCLFQFPQTLPLHKRQSRNYFQSSNGDGVEIVIVFFFIGCFKPGIEWSAVRTHVPTRGTLSSSCCNHEGQPCFPITFISHLQQTGCPGDVLGLKNGRRWQGGGRCGRLHVPHQKLLLPMGCDISCRHNPHPKNTRRRTNKHKHAHVRLNAYRFHLLHWCIPSCDINSNANSP